MSSSQNSVLLQVRSLQEYHAGVRAYTPSFKGLVATGYIVNALFNSPTEGVHSENGKRGFIGQLNYTDPKGKYTAIGTYGYNKDRISGTTTDRIV